MTTADLCAYAFKSTFQEELFTLFQSDAATNKHKQGTRLNLPLPALFWSFYHYTRELFMVSL